VGDARAAPIKLPGTAKRTATPVRPPLPFRGVVGVGGWGFKFRFPLPQPNPNVRVATQVSDRCPRSPTRPPKTEVGIMGGYQTLPSRLAHSPQPSTSDNPIMSSSEVFHRAIVGLG